MFYFQQLLLRLILTLGEQGNEIGREYVTNIDYELQG
jgi:hypothetical protein